jgi:hypothetical protein
MKVDVSLVFKTLDGTELALNIQDPNGPKMDLKSICTSALLSTEGDNSNIEGAEKVKRYELALTIHKAEKEVELEVEEVALLKRLIGKMYLPLIVGQAFAYLEGKKV